MPRSSEPPGQLGSRDSTRNPVCVLCIWVRKSWETRWEFKSSFSTRGVTTEQRSSWTVKSTRRGKTAKLHRPTRILHVSCTKTERGCAKSVLTLTPVQSLPYQLFPTMWIILPENRLLEPFQHVSWSIHQLYSRLKYHMSTAKGITTKKVICMVTNWMYHMDVVNCSNSIGTVTVVFCV